MFNCCLLTFQTIKMKLEDEIKQKEFKSQQHKLSVNIGYTANWFEGKFSKLLKEYNLTPQQYNILRILRGQNPNPATIKLLKERMLDKMSDASRLVDNLFKKGFLKRETAAYDRRHCDVLINEKGLETLAEIDKRLPDHEKLLDTLSLDEMQILNDLLDKLRG